MLEFRYPELKDREWVQPILSSAGGLGSEYAFGTMYVWRGTYHRRICRYKDFLLSAFGEDYRSYVVPEGVGDRREAISVLMEDARERGVPFRMWGVTEDNREEMEGYFPGRFDYLPQRDDADYIYRSEDLISLAGRKFHSKRNHIARFRRTYQWTYEAVGPENAGECLAIAREWCRKNGMCGQNGHSAENCAIADALDHLGPLGMKGGLIRVEGKPAAFTLGEEINSRCFVVHFEKATTACTRPSTRNSPPGSSPGMNISTGRRTWAWRACGRRSFRTTRLFWWKNLPPFSRGKRYDGPGAPRHGARPEAAVAGLLP